MIIAIDGPAAAGKGTLGRRLADHFALAHLDSGRLYRAVALKLLRQGKNQEDEQAAIDAASGLSIDELDDQGLRDEGVGRLASVIAAMPSVRHALIGFQREFANHPPGNARGAVIDGRDIGTIVCPQATHKLFVTASVETRAKRRLKELRARGERSIYARILQDMKERDTRDSQRDIAPLAVAVDAFVLDTSELDADAAFQAAFDFITLRSAADGVGVAEPTGAP